MKFVCVFLVAVISVFSIAAAKPERCNLPKEIGRCFAAFPSFYYDSADGQCKDFIYGGCGGNDNRFQTKEECAQICA